MGIYDGLEERAQKHKESVNKWEAEQKARKEALKEIEIKIRPFIVEGIDGFPRIATMAGIKPRETKRNLFFLKSIIPIKVWYLGSTIYGGDYYIDETGKLYAGGFGGLEPREKKLYVDAMIDGLIKSSVLVNADSYTLKHWDCETWIKHIFECGLKLRDEMMDSKYYVKEQ